MMIHRMPGMIAVVVVLMGSLSAYAASTLTFSCNSNPPLNLTLTSFSFNSDTSRGSTGGGQVQRGSGQDHPKERSMTIRFPVSKSNTVMQHLLTSNELLQSCQLIENKTGQMPDRKEQEVIGEVWTFKNVRVTAMTTKAGEASEVKGSALTAKAGEAPDMKVNAMTAKAGEASEVKAANSNAKPEFCQATLTFEESSWVKK
jgi:hypothetical protein